jgi:hypothetical protein
MVIRLHKFKLIPALVIIALAIILRITFLEIDTDILEKWRNAIRYSMIFVVLIHAIYNYRKLNYKFELILYLAVVSLVSFRNGSFNFLVLICIAVICFRYTDTFVTRVLVAGEIVGAIYFFTLLALGEIKSEMYLHRGNYAQMNRLRITLGFSNVNLAGMFFLSLGMLIIMSKKGKSIVNWIIGTSIIFGGYAITKARTAYMCATIFIGLYILFMLCKKMFCVGPRTRQKIMISIDVMVILTALIPLASGFIYKRFPYLNAFSTGRFFLYDKYIRSFRDAVWLFGRRENAMVYCLTLVFIAKFGIIVGIWTLYYIIQAINRLFLSGKYIEVCYIIAIFVADISETYLLRLSDMMVILFWVLVFRNSRLNAEIESDELEYSNSFNDYLIEDKG